MSTPRKRIFIVWDVPPTVPPPGSKCVGCVPPGGLLSTYTGNEVLADLLGEKFVHSLDVPPTAPTTVQKPSEIAGSQDFQMEAPDLEAVEGVISIGTAPE